MDFLAATFSSLLSIVFFCLFVAGVLKLFQIATTLTEIKDLLSAAQRSESPALRHAVAPPSLASVSPSPNAQSTVPQGIVPQSLVPRNPAEIPLSGEAMLRQLDLEMRLEEAQRTPPVVDATEASALPNSQPAEPR